jgi:hypothetical protein
VREALGPKDLGGKTAARRMHEGAEAEGPAENETATVDIRKHGDVSLQVECKAHVPRLRHGGLAQPRESAGVADQKVSLNPAFHIEP